MALLFLSQNDHLFGLVGIFTFMKLLHLLWIIPVVLLLVYLLGPRPKFAQVDPMLPNISMPLTDLDAFIAEQEAQVTDLRPGNQAQIKWYQDSIQKTPYVLVYLHGFSASPMEGDPVHFEFAERYGCNLYLPRMADHGRGTIESFKDLTPADLMNSAKEALAIAQLLGDKVILMATSTGATYGTYLAAHNPEAIDGMILYSPNFDLANSTSQLLVGPWGRQLARRIIGEYRGFDFPKDGAKFWTTQYRVEGVIALRALVNQTMTKETWSKISPPYMVGYYYKNDEECDQTISVDAIQSFYETTQTPAEQKRLYPFPDVGVHNIVSKYRSKDLDAVRQKTWEFAAEVLGLEKI